jgi:hypothetical protein
VLPDRIQFWPKVDPGEEGKLIQETVGKIIEVLPETPYRAAGLNFDWVISDEKKPISDLTRGLFFSEKDPLCKLFDTGDACFGGYYSKTIFDCRLKVDARPMVKLGPEEPDYLLLSFNYHLGISETAPVNQIKGLLVRWNEAKAEAARIVDIVKGQLQ